jgi:hypothetical protein
MAFGLRLGYKEVAPHRNSGLERNRGTAADESSIGTGGELSSATMIGVEG